MIYVMFCITRFEHLTCETPPYSVLSSVLRNISQQDFKKKAFIQNLF